MRELERPVARVFRRLRYQRFLAALVWSTALSLAVVAGVIAAEKLLNRSLPGAEWAPVRRSRRRNSLAAAVFLAADRP